MKKAQPASARREVQLVDARGLYLHFFFSHMNIEFLKTSASKCASNCRVRCLSSQQVFSRNGRSFSSSRLHTPPNNLYFTLAICA